MSSAKAEVIMKTLHVTQSLERLPPSDMHSVLWTASRPSSGIASWKTCYSERVWQPSSALRDDCIKCFFFKQRKKKTVLARNLQSWHFSACYRPPPWRGLEDRGGLKGLGDVWREERMELGEVLSCRGQLLASYRLSDGCLTPPGDGLAPSLCGERQTRG